VKSILDRENLSCVVVQSSLNEPSTPTFNIPSDRFVWTWPFDNLLYPGWAKQKELKHLHEVLEAVDGVIDQAAAHNCRGLKTAMAYWRPLALGEVSQSQAEKAYQFLSANEPSGYGFRKEPHYNDPKSSEMLRMYQDYLIKHIYIKAGEIDLPIIIHVATAYSPEMRCVWNDPIQLYDIFRDKDILRAETKFILIHTGYPYFHVVASMISRFPNVFTDISFLSLFPGLLEQVLRTFLSLAPSRKVLHASDSGYVPEQIGYSASNTRKAISHVLQEFKDSYGWTWDDCRKAAKNVFSENAKRLFKIN
jgi:predicted TIM-barrel fold metal-dependent hydrolase